MESKICKSCKEVKSVNDFIPRKTSKDRLSYLCRLCWNKETREYRLRNPEMVKKVNRSAYLKNREERIKYASEYAKSNPMVKVKTRENHKKKFPEYSRMSTLKKYGLTIESFNQMLEETDNCCWICKDRFVRKEDANVDHCHTSGKVRGILCSACNTALGLARDNETILSSMIKYLQKANGKEL